MFFEIVVWKHFFVSGIEPLLTSLVYFLIAKWNLLAVCVGVCVCVCVCVCVVCVCVCVCVCVFPSLFT